ncbi:hypothetical protein V495_03855 [Pseudogymnoascus sp. VKM F-4514 (FW-929)]|nr:hypothetical protein V495_03855 [Pseudogymnoascus sp. VKM F-4514 (FW-929)]KFY60517.1 hypothetical protein V497_03581 [Pseudogymnoascus sp. VKM F-4516 (FW-969)]
MAPIDRKATLALEEDIIRLGTAAYDPQLPKETAEAGVQEFDTFLERTAAYVLIPALVSLVKPDRLEPWLRAPVSRALSRLPLRPRGVRSTIEFVLSVHPTTVATAETRGQDAASKGPQISPEALTFATQLICSPPQGVTPYYWFEHLAPQLFSLLDGNGGLDMVKVAAYIIGYGILGRPQFGAPPDAPGWQLLAEPILRCIDPSQGRSIAKSDSETIVGARSILSSDAELADALRRLASLISSHPNPGLSRRLLRNIVLPLWSLASWPAEGSELEDYRAPAGFLLHIILQLSVDGAQLIRIADNLMCRRTHGGRLMRWKYVESGKGGIRIVKSTPSDDEPFGKLLSIHKVIDEKSIDFKVNCFLDVVKLASTSDAFGISNLFIIICRRWLVEEDGPAPSELLITPADSRPPRNFEEKIIDAKVLQGLIETVPNKLVEESAQVLELSSNILQRATRRGNIENDDTVPISLSLLNMVFTSPSFKASSMSQSRITSIQGSLTVIAKSETESSTTAQNLNMLLDFKLIEPDAFDVPPPTVSERVLEDRRTYKLATGYITSPDSPAPVRAEGLDLLTTLITGRSPILDVPASMILLSSLIQDEEEYIYLRVIKSFIQLSVAHPKSVLNGILERYFDANEDLNLDTRLRLGEALAQVIEKTGEAFTGDVAHHVCEGLLALAGRRGHRPKSQEEKTKKRAAEKRKNKAAEDAWGGPVPQLDDIPEDHDPEVDAILNQIVEGWEGKRDEEDVRIRASALSVFASAIDSNVAGIGPAIVGGGVDLAINMLPLEPEPEKAILRRSAIMVVLALIHAIDAAKDAGRDIGIGFAGQSLADVTRVFQYISETDNDGLVRQHATETLEQLKDWQMKELSGTNVGGNLDSNLGLEFGSLRGLSLGQASTISGPRIEEIE